MSVAQVARRYALNTNVAFKWLRDMTPRLSRVKAKRNGRLFPAGQDRWLARSDHTAPPIDAAPGGSPRLTLHVDETCLRVNGRWSCLWRPVDRRRGSDFGSIRRQRRQGHGPSEMACIGSLESRPSARKNTLLRREPRDHCRVTLRTASKSPKLGRQREWSGRHTARAAS